MSQLKWMCSGVLSLWALCLFAQIDRIEPMNWWVGMKNPELQLMISGKSIGETSPSLVYPGVSIKAVHRGDSKNYLFVDLVIAADTKPGSFKINFKKAGQATQTFTYNLLPRNKSAQNQMGFSSKDVIYLVTPDRFVNGDPRNDFSDTLQEKTIDRKSDYARHGGDIRGIINSLDYLADLGITAIWPTPLLENNMPKWSYHGYAITDYYKVDPRFGNLVDYKELADKARQKGIKLIKDDVVNHSGVQYWWMQDLPFKNWVNYADSIQETNHRRTTIEDPYAAEVDKKLMVKGWFVPDMPDLNQDNPFMAKFLIQNSIWWIETLGLGGIRQDTYPYSTKSFLKDWTCSIMREYPNFSIVGEEWSTNPLIASYWQQGKKNSDGYVSCLESPMDFPLQQALIQGLVEPESWDKGLVKLYEALANDFVYANPQALLVFGENHDMNRLFTQVKEDVDLLQMALTYLLTIRGIPQLYYGTEVLLQNTAKPGDHGLIRSDFPGGWAGDPASGFTGEGLNPNQVRIQSFLKKMLNWRKQKNVIHEGKTLHFAPSNGVYTYCRYNATETVLVILNKNTEAKTIDLSHYAEAIKGKTNAVDVLSGETLTLGKNLQVKARMATVLELKK
jgi:glycosidase